MRILITGGAGFIGSAVVRRAIRQGHEVLNLDALTYASCLENLKEVENHKIYSFPVSYTHLKLPTNSEV